MEGATQYLIAVPQALAPDARQAATTWDEAGADSMFRHPTLHPVGESENLYVFSYGWISDDHANDIQGAVEAYFPGGKMVAAHTFDAALASVGLEQLLLIP